MDLSLLKRQSDYEWRIEPSGRMRVPGIIFADEALVRDMDHKVYEQVVNVAMLPGIQKASYAMPDAHWGYGFPIGGVAEEAPGAYKDVSAVVDTADEAKLARKVARLEPLVCVKG
jgi:tRNA-splicing ligase RtcB